MNENFILQGYDYVGNPVYGNYPGVANQPGAISGYGSVFKAPSYNPIGKAPLQGYVSNVPKELPEETIKALDTIYPKAQPNISLLNKIQSGKIGTGWKLAPITGDAYDTVRGYYRMTHGDPLLGGAQFGLGLLGLGTLGTSSLVKSGAKAAVKGGAKLAPRVLSFSDIFAKNIAKESPKFASGYRQFKRGVDKANLFAHNNWLRWPVRVDDFFSWFNGNNPGDEEKASQPSIPNANNEDNGIKEPNDFFGGLPELPSDDIYNIDYPSWLPSMPPSQGLDFSGDETPGYTKEDFIGALSGLGYTDDAIEDALKGNYNGMPEMKANIEAYNKLVPPEQQIKIIEPSKEDTEEIQPVQFNEDGALIGSISEDDNQPNIDDLEYAEALADIDDIVGDTRSEYEPYLKGLASYLKNYDKYWRNYLGLKRYYAGLSNMSGDRVFNEVPNGLDPRDIEATRLDLYKKLADDKLAIENQQRQLRGNIDLAKALGYPARAAFASKDMLNAFSNAKLAESRIKATEAIAQLKADNDAKIAEMNNRRAMEVAKLNGVNALQRVQFQQNEANYRKALDIKQKELDRQLERAIRIGNWSEARKLRMYQEQNANKRSAVTALTNYMTFGDTGNGMSIYDIVSILGGDTTKLMGNLNKKQNNNQNSTEQIIMELNNNE